MTHRPICYEVCNKSVSVLEDPVRGSASQQCSNVCVIAEGQDPCIWQQSRQQLCITEPRRVCFFRSPRSMCIPVQAMDCDDAGFSTLVFDFWGRVMGEREGEV